MKMNVSLVRECTKNPAQVVVGMVNGITNIATIHRFDPNQGNLVLEIPTKGSNGKLSVFEKSIPQSDIAFVGFREQRLGQKKDKKYREFNIHLIGKQVFHVRANPDDLLNRPGFYATSISNQDLSKEFFFFSHAIIAREDREPLGMMMINSGIVDSIDLDAGVNQQISYKNAPIGQILVEQQIITSKKIEEAAKEQQAQAKRGKPMRLGEVLVEAGLATDDDIKKALAEQKNRKGKRLGEVLIELGVVKEVDVAQTLAAKFHLPFVDLDEMDLTPEAVSEIPLQMIEKYRVFPFQSTGSTLTVALSDPLAMEPLDMLRFSLNKSLVEVMVTPSQLERYISTYLSVSESENSGVKKGMDEILTDLNNENSDVNRAFSKEAFESTEDDSAVAQLVNRTFVDAHRQGASDIHVEPYGRTNDTVIRFRVDGICHVYQKIPAAFRDQVVARIKIMADMDITERRKPQDGKIRFKIGKRIVELRVATIPTVNGNEDVVLRILAGAGAMPLDKMSFSDKTLSRIKNMVTKPYGLILCVGPTGSGKTTTLHALVGHINDDTRKIWTAEDPVEITQAGLRQVQVKPDIDFTFAAAMRSFLRADPDVILVGEMRDLETASIGVEASLTGHLVLSTLHTNSAAETITRLIDMGLDPFSFSDALLGVLAQRLARRLCDNCKTSRLATSVEHKEIAHYYGPIGLEKYLDGKPLMLWSAKGCEHCKQKKYKGRIGLHELLIMDEQMRAAVQKKTPVDEMLKMARRKGMRTLLQDGIEKCIDGTTDLKQVLAVCSR